jgi:small subunit ribosomal protein SAe
VTHRNETGTPIINIEETYQKIRLAARVIAGIPNIQDVLVVSSRPYGQRAVIKFASYTGSTSTSNARWVPGTLTNQETKHFKEPRLLIVVDTYADRKALVEASYMNIPVISLVNLDSDLQFVDIAIPCNNKVTESISMVFWLLAREVLIAKGLHDRNEPWNVYVDLFYHKTIEQIAAGEKTAEANAEAAKTQDWDKNADEAPEDEDGEGEDWKDDN